MSCTEGLRVRAIERVENGLQQENFDQMRESAKADLASMGVAFESGVHSRWLWHGAANAKVL